MQCFDSKLVRLKGDNLSDFIIDNHEFQFQTGSIKRGQVWNMRRIMSSFNSKLVRLKVKMKFVYTPISKSFQFQTGSIKRFKSKGIRNCKSNKFQFQTGSIKRDILKSFYDGHISFNSKLVRLKTCKSCSNQTIVLVSIPNWFD